MKDGNRFIKGFVKEVAKEFPVEGAKALCGIQAWRLERQQNPWPELVK